MPGRIGLIGANGVTGGSSGRGRIGLIGATGGGDVESGSTSGGSHHGGILGGIEHVASSVKHGVESGARDVANGALSLGTGLYDYGAAEAGSIKQTVEHPIVSRKKFDEMWAHPERPVAGTASTPAVTAIGKGLVDSTTSTNPTDLALNALTLLSLGGGAAARAAYLAKVAKAARVAETGDLVEEGSDAAKAAQAAGHTVTPLSSSEKASLARRTLTPKSKPPMAERTLKVPKLETPEGEGPARLTHEPVQIGTASQNPLMRMFQAAHDTVAQKALDNGVETTRQTRTARYAEKRVAGGVGESTRVTRNVRASDVAKVARAGKNLDKGVPKRLGELAMFLRSANVTGKEAADFWKAQAEAGVGDRIKAGRGIGQTQTAYLAKAAQAVHDRGLLKIGDDGNVTVDAAKFPRLAAADESVKLGQAARAQIISDRGLLSPEQMQERLNLVGRTMAGGKFVKPTPAKLGKPSPALVEQRAYVARLEADFEKSQTRDNTALSLAQQSAAGKRSIVAGDLLPVHLGGRGVSPITERLGAALSVAKDKLQRMEAAAARRVEPTGIVGGEGARSGQGFVSLRTGLPKSPQAPVVRSRGGVVGAVKQTIVGKRATGSGVAKGLVPVSTTKAVARGLHEALRFVNSDELRGAVARLGSDVKRTGDDILIRDPAADKAASRLPQTIREILGESESTVTEPGEDSLRLAAKKLLETHIRGLGDNFAKDARAALGERAPTGYKWVPRQLVPDELTSAVEARGKAEKFFDMVNSAVTSATVYFKLGHLPTRFLTNLSTNAVQGSLSPGELKRSVTLARDLTDEQKMDLLAATGTHGYQALPHAGVGKVARFASAGAGWWARRVDAPFRLNAILYELRQVGIDTPEAIDKALAQLKDPARSGMSASQISKLDGAVRRANRASIMYDGLSAAEKRHVARYVWFYPWTKGAVRFAAHTVAEHPVKAALGSAIGQQGAQDRQRLLGNVPGYELALTALGGGPRPVAANFSTFTPYSTVGDVAQMVAHPLGESGVLDQLNPVYSGITRLVADSLAGKPHALGNALSELGSPTPELQVFNAYRHPPGPTRMFGATQLGVSNPKAASALSALLRGLAGPAVPRPTNLTVLNRVAR